MNDGLENIGSIVKRVLNELAKNSIGSLGICPGFQCNGGANDKASCGIISPSLLNGRGDEKEITIV